MASNKRPPLEMDDITKSLKQSSGKGVDAFFSSSPTQAEEKMNEVVNKTPSPAIKEDTNDRDIMVSRYHDTVVSPHHDTMVIFTEEYIVETIRKAVKQFGKEPATQRLTMEEKQELKDIEYSYDRQGIKTTGNEIIRIAINFLILDYKKNGVNSTLEKVIKKLNS